MLLAIREIIERAAGHETVEREIQIQGRDSVMTGGYRRYIARREGEGIGVMLFLEDITQIQKVQRMEARREVARRIAHEIKNPLTPIQLSAERLRKRYMPLLQGDGAILDKCTSTIITQVEELKNWSTRSRSSTGCPRRSLPVAISMRSSARRSFYQRGTIRLL